MTHCLWIVPHGLERKNGGGVWRYRFEIATCIWDRNTTGTRRAFFQAFLVHNSGHLMDYCTGRVLVGNRVFFFAYPYSKHPVQYMVVKWLPPGGRFPGQRNSSGTKPTTQQYSATLVPHLSTGQRQSKLQVHQSSRHIATIEYRCITGYYDTNVILVLRIKTKEQQQQI